MSDGSSAQPPQGTVTPEFVKILEAIKQETNFFDWERNPPPDGFDPRKDEFKDQLAAYGLPPEPDPERFPVRHAFWQKMFSREDSSDPVEFVQSTFEYEDVEPDLGRVSAKPPFPGFRRSPRARRVGRGIAARDTSVNWCGAYLTAHDGRIITEIHGSWRVPKVDVPAAIPFNSLEHGEELRCSSWLGLDGQRGYVNASLPQIGTSHFVKKLGSWRQPKHGVWWQWWLRDVPNPPPIRLPLGVEPGHEIMASLFVVDSTHVIYLIANHTTGQVCTPFMEPEPSSYLAPTLPGRPVRVSGATGEWITERPVNWTTGQPDKMPFFEQVVFEDCLVVLGRAPQVDEREERPGGTLLINATRVDKGVPRTVTVARAKRLGLGKFSTTFLGTATEEQGGILSAGSAPPPATGP